MQNRMTDEEIRRIEAMWKSDMDRKVDALVKFASEYEELLQMLIKREANRQKMQQAIIEKSLSALVWAAIAGVATLAWAGLSGEIRLIAAALKKDGQ